MSHTLTMLGDSVARALSDVVDPRQTLQAEKTGFDRRAWEQLHALGVVGADAAEMSLEELAVVIDKVAAAGVLAPYADSEALGRWLAGGADLDVDADVLTAVVADESSAELRPDGGARLRVEGVCVPWGCAADRVLLSFAVGDSCYLASAACSQMELRRVPSLAGEPHARIVGEVVLPAADVHEVSPMRGPEALRLRGALCRALQMVGALSRVNALTLQYARDRKQFKRSLSDFQVIQSHLAAMAGELSGAAISVEVALATGATAEAMEAVATAKVRAGQAARQISALAHQIHGAIGFTQEYPLNLWTRRLWTWRDEYGTEAEWALQIARSSVAHGADALWQRLAMEGTDHE